MAKKKTKAASGIDATRTDVVIDPVLLVSTLVESSGEEVVSEPQESAPPPALEKAQGPRCETCTFYNTLTDAVGECRRYPPTVVIPALTLTTHGPLGIFPITLLDASCGEYKSS